MLEIAFFANIICTIWCGKLAIFGFKQGHIKEAWISLALSSLAMACAASSFTRL